MTFGRPIWLAISTHYCPITGLRIFNIINTTITYENASLERMRAYAQTLGDLRHRIAPLGNLGHRIPFEIVAESTSTHDRLLASKLGKKTSTNLGAIQRGATGFV